ncbi:MAG: GNAT family N-acetyltransferase [Pseudomonadota bacterium]
MTAEPGKFVIRPIAATDAAEIVQMSKELSAHEGVTPPLVVTEDIERELASPDCLIFGFMAEEGPDMLGYALHCMQFDTESGRRGAFLCDLYVRPAGRRRGLATAFIEAVARDGKARGGTWVSWHALANNAEARAFYATVGSVEEGVELWSLSNALFARFTDPA